MEARERCASSRSFRLTAANPLEEPPAVNRPMLRVLLVLLLGLASVPALAAQEWTPFQSGDGRFQVLVPQAPGHRTLVTETPIGSITNHVFLARSAMGSFTISYSDLPAVGIAFKGGAEGIYDEAAAALLEGLQGTSTSQKRVKHAGRNARDLTYTAPGTPESGPLQGRARMYLVGKRLYVVDAVIRSTGDASELPRFLDSFQLLSGN